MPAVCVTGVVDFDDLAHKNDHAVFVCFEGVKIRVVARCIETSVKWSSALRSAPYVLEMMLKKYCR